MNITISQQRLAIGDKYSLTVDGALRYSAKSKIMKFLYEASLQDTQGRGVTTINRRFSVLKAQYDIRLVSGRTFTFRQESLLKPVYSCSSGAEKYEIFGHRGLKYSVFKRGRQIAAVSKNRLTIMEGDDFQIVADDEANPELMCSIVLVLDNLLHSSQDKSTVTMDFGNFLQARPFDEEWQPRRSA